MKRWSSAHAAGGARAATGRTTTATSTRASAAEVAALSLYFSNAEGNQDHNRSVGQDSHGELLLSCFANESQLKIGERPAINAAIACLKDK